MLPLQMGSTNEELDKLIKHKNIVNCIKARRLSWFGHVQRMPDTGTVNTLWTGDADLRLYITTVQDG